MKLVPDGMMPNASHLIADGSGDTLEGQQREDFLCTLSIIAGEGTPDYKWKFINSTARQRCAAFVAVKSRET